MPVRAVADIYGSTRLCYGEIRATTVCLTAGLTGVIGLHSATVVHYTERQSPRPLFPVQVSSAVLRSSLSISVPTPTKRRPVSFT